MYSSIRTATNSNSDVQLPQRTSLSDRAQWRLVENRRLRCAVVAVAHWEDCARWQHGEPVDLSSRMSK